MRGRRPQAMSSAYTLAFASSCSGATSSSTRPSFRPCSALIGCTYRTTRGSRWVKYSEDRVQDQGYHSQGPGSGVPQSGSRIRGTTVRVQDQGYQQSGSRIRGNNSQGPGLGVPQSGSRIRGTTVRVQDQGYHSQGPGYRLVRGPGFTGFTNMDGRGHLHACRWPTSIQLPGRPVEASALASAGLAAILEIQTHATASWMLQSFVERGRHETRGIFGISWGPPTNIYNIINN